MSLYARLLALSAGHVRTEDTLTEVVAHVLRLDAAARADADTSLVVRGLRTIGALPGWPAVTTVRIDTQRHLAAVEGHGELVDHTSASRPDLVVDLTAVDGRAGVVFVESKVGSVEGAGQLKRYAEQLQVLHAAPPALRPALVYLTRSPDPKEHADVCAGAPGVTFRQARWHDVYRLVRDARPSAPPALHLHYDDLLAFFSALDMDHAPRFDPADALALARIPQTLRFLDETLVRGDNPPKPRFVALLGRASDPSLNQLSRYSRSPLFKTYGVEDASFEILMGYQFLKEGFARLYVELGSKSAAGGGGNVARTVQTLGGTPAEAAVSGGLGGARWNAWEHPEIKWSGATVSVSVASLLGAHDHVAAIQSAFAALLDELERVMALHPDLPWTAPGAAPADPNAPA